MRYAIVIEKAEGNYSAYVPDLTGCVATGATVAEVETEIREAILFHLDGLREDENEVSVQTHLYSSYVGAKRFASPSWHCVAVNRKSQDTRLVRDGEVPFIRWASRLCDVRYRPQLGA